VITLRADPRRLANGESRDAAEVNPAGSKCSHQGWSNAERTAVGKDLDAARADLRLETTRAFYAVLTARETRPATPQVISP
jgi:hypothetical protein